MSRFDTPPTVIGVIPPGVRFLPSPGAAQEPNYNVNGLVQFWIPVTTDPAPSKPCNGTWSRLRDGATPAQAESELRLLASRQAQVERSFEGFASKIELLSNELNASGNRILLRQMVAAALVLLIACRNARGFAARARIAASAGVWRCAARSACAASLHSARLPPIERRSIFGDSRGPLSSAVALR